MICRDPGIALEGWTAKSVFRRMFVHSIRSHAHPDKNTILGNSFVVR